MKNDVIHHPFVEQLHLEYHLVSDNPSADRDNFICIGRNEVIQWVYSTSTFQQIRAYLKSHPDTIIVVFHDENESIVDLYAQSVLDESPVVVHDLNWREEKDFWSLSPSESSMGYILELDRHYGRKRIEYSFVTAFKSQHRLLSKSWTGLTEDTPEIRHYLSLHTLIRLLFIAFLETRHALDNRTHFMMEEAQLCISRKQSVYHDFIRPLFFKTLNCSKSRRVKQARNFGRVPFLNGGLFSPTRHEIHNPQLNAPNEVWITILNKLFMPYHFSTEPSASGSHLSLDPMMLGHVFETLMSTDQRSMTGSFYTPVHMARQIVRQTLSRWIAANTDISVTQASAMCENNDFRDISVETAKTLDHLISHMTILDPAAGSGSFLQSAVECLYQIRCGLTRITQTPCHGGLMIKNILANNIYGIDILPDAIELCCLRLWLGLVGKTPENEPLPPLPNLDMNIRCGDTLADLSQYRQILDVQPLDSQEVRVFAEMKSKYRLSTGSKKQQLAWAIHQQTDRWTKQLFDRLYESCVRDYSESLSRRKNLFGEIQSPSYVQKKQSHQLQCYCDQIKQWRDNQAISPGFSFDIHYSEVMERGGFDVILGNPPWFSLHTMPKPAQMVLKNLYQTAESQSGRKNQSIDISALFVEKSISCVRPGGFVSMILPNKLLHAPSYERFRTHVESHAHVHSCQNLSQNLFDASTYPCAIIMQRMDMPEPGRKLGLTESLRPVIEEPDPQVRSLLRFEQKLGERWNVKRGICTGANDIFVGEHLYENDQTIAVKFRHYDQAVKLERQLVHPVLKGASIRPYRAETVSCILLPWQLSSGQYLQSLPPLAAHWFSSQRSALLKRRIALHPYYAVSGCCRELNEMKVVWRDISCQLEACFIENPDIVPLNTVYYIPVKSAFEGYFLASYLNSTMVRQFCRSRAEHALNGYRRYFAWLIQDIPWIFGDANLESNPVCQKIVELSRACHQSSDESERAEIARRADDLFQQCLHHQPSMGTCRSPRQRQFALYHARKHKAA